MFKDNTKLVTTTGKPLDETTNPDEIVVREDPNSAPGFTIEEILADVQSYKALKTCFQYLGFDPVKAREEIMKSHKMEKIIYVIYFVMVRGTRYDRYDSKTNKNHMLKLKKYLSEMKVEVNGKNKGQNVLTLGRICAAFPDVCSSILAQNPDIVKFKIDTLPYWLQFPNGLTLIPSDQYTIIGEWKRWANIFSNSVGANFQDQSKFWTLQERSKMFSEDEKRKFTKDDWWKTKNDAATSSKQKSVAPPKQQGDNITKPTNSSTIKNTVDINVGDNTMAKLPKGDDQQSDFGSDLVKSDDQSEISFQTILPDGSMMKIKIDDDSYLNLSKHFNQYKSYSSYKGNIIHDGTEINMRLFRNLIQTCHDSNMSIVKLSVPNAYRKMNQYLVGFCYESEIYKSFLMEGECKSLVFRNNNFVLIKGVTNYNFEVLAGRF